MDKKTLWALVPGTPLPSQISELSPGICGRIFNDLNGETNSLDIDTLIAGVSTRYGWTNQITDYSLKGQLQFALTDNWYERPDHLPR
jgi:hypothetical protein